jgi:hypothetical protein
MCFFLLDNERKEKKSEEKMRKLTKVKKKVVSLQSQTMSGKTSLKVWGVL